MNNLSSAQKYLVSEASEAKAQSDLVPENGTHASISSNDPQGSGESRRKPLAASLSPTWRAQATDPSFLTVDEVLSAYRKAKAALQVEAYAGDDDDRSDDERASHAHHEHHLPLIESGAHDGKNPSDAVVCPASNDVRPDEEVSFPVFEVMLMFLGMNHFSKSNRQKLYSDLRTKGNAALRQSSMDVGVEHSELRVAGKGETPLASSSSVSSKTSSAAQIGPSVEPLAVGDPTKPDFALPGQQERTSDAALATERSVEQSGSGSSSHHDAVTHTSSCLTFGLAVDESQMVMTDVPSLTANIKNESNEPLLVAVQSAHTALSPPEDAVTPSFSTQAKRSPLSTTPSLGLATPMHNAPELAVVTVSLIAQFVNMICALHRRLEGRLRHHSHVSSTRSAAELSVRSHDAAHQTSVSLTTPLAVHTTAVGGGSFLGASMGPSGSVLLSAQSSQIQNVRLTPHHMSHVSITDTSSSPLQRVSTASALLPDEPVGGNALTFDDLRNNNQDRSAHDDNDSQSVLSVSSTDPEGHEPSRSCDIVKTAMEPPGTSNPGDTKGIEERPFEDVTVINLAAFCSGVVIGHFADPTDTSKEVDDRCAWAAETQLLGESDEAVVVSFMLACHPDRGLDDGGVDIHFQDSIEPLPTNTDQRIGQEHLAGFDSSEAILLLPGNSSAYVPYSEKVVQKALEAVIIGIRNFEGDVVDIRQWHDFSDLRSPLYHDDAMEDADNVDDDADDVLQPKHASTASRRSMCIEVVAVWKERRSPQLCKDILSGAFSAQENWLTRPYCDQLPASHVLFATASCSSLDERFLNTPRKSLLRSELLLASKSRTRSRDDECAMGANAPFTIDGADRTPQLMHVVSGVLVAQASKLCVAALAACERQRDVLSPKTLESVAASHLENCATGKERKRSQDFFSIIAARKGGRSVQLAAVDDEPLSPVAASRSAMFLPLILSTSDKVDESAMASGKPLRSRVLSMSKLLTPPFLISAISAGVDDFFNEERISTQLVITLEVCSELSPCSAERCGVSVVRSWAAHFFGNPTSRQEDAVSSFALLGEAHAQDTADDRSLCARVTLIVNWHLASDELRRIEGRRMLKSNTDSASRSSPLVIVEIVTASLRRFFAHSKLESVVKSLCVGATVGTVEMRVRGLHGVACRRSHEGPAIDRSLANFIAAKKRLLADRIPTLAEAVLSVAVDDTVLAVTPDVQQLLFSTSCYDNSSNSGFRPEMSDAGYEHRRWHKQEPLIGTVLDAIASRVGAVTFSCSRELNSELCSDVHEDAQLALQVYLGWIVLAGADSDAQRNSKKAKHLKADSTSEVLTKSRDSSSIALEGVDKATPTNCETKRLTDTSEVPTKTRGSSCDETLIPSVEDNEVTPLQRKLAATEKPSLVVPSRRNVVVEDGVEEVQGIVEDDDVTSSAIADGVVESVRRKHKSVDRIERQRKDRRRKERLSLTQLAEYDEFVDPSAPRTAQPPLAKDRTPLSSQPVTRVASLQDVAPNSDEDVNSNESTGTMSRSTSRESSFSTTDRLPYAAFVRLWDTTDMSVFQSCLRDEEAAIDQAFLSEQPDASVRKRCAEAVVIAGPPGCGKFSVALNALRLCPTLSVPVVHECSLQCNVGESGHESSFVGSLAAFVYKEFFLSRWRRSDASKSDCNLGTAVPTVTCSLSEAIEKRLALICELILFEDKFSNIIASDSAATSRRRRQSDNLNSMRCAVLKRNLFYLLVFSLESFLLVLHSACEGGRDQRGKPDIVFCNGIIQASRFRRICFILRQGHLLDRTCLEWLDRLLWGTGYADAVVEVLLMQLRCEKHTSAANPLNSVQEEHSSPDVRQGDAAGLHWMRCALLETQSTYSEELRLRREWSGSVEGNACQASTTDRPLQFDIVFTVTPCYGLERQSDPVNFLLAAMPRVSGFLQPTLGTIDEKFNTGTRKAFPSPTGFADEKQPELNGVFFGREGLLRDAVDSPACNWATVHRLQGSLNDLAVRSPTLGPVLVCLVIGNVSFYEARQLFAHCLGITSHNDRVNKAPRGKDHSSSFSFSAGPPPPAKDSDRGVGSIDQVDRSSSAASMARKSTTRFFPGFFPTNVVLQCDDELLAMMSRKTHHNPACVAHLALYLLENAMLVTNSVPTPFGGPPRDISVALLPATLLRIEHQVPWITIAPSFARTRLDPLLNALPPHLLTLCKIVAIITEQPLITAFFDSIGKVYLSLSHGQHMLDVADVVTLDRLQILKMCYHRCSAHKGVEGSELDAAVFALPALKDCVFSRLVFPQREAINKICGDCYHDTHPMDHPTQFLVRGRHYLFAGLRQRFLADAQRGLQLLSPPPPSPASTAATMDCAGSNTSVPAILVVTPSNRNVTRRSCAASDTPPEGNRPAPSNGSLLAMNHFFQMFDAPIIRRRFFDWILHMCQELRDEQTVNVVKKRLQERKQQTAQLKETSPIIACPVAPLALKPLTEVMLSPQMTSDGADDLVLISPTALSERHAGSSCTDVGGRRANEAQPSGPREEEFHLPVPISTTMRPAQPDHTFLLAFGGGGGAGSVTSGQQAQSIEYLKQLSNRTLHIHHLQHEVVGTAVWSYLFQGNPKVEDEFVEHYLRSRKEGLVGESNAMTRYHRWTTDWRQRVPSAQHGIPFREAARVGVQQLPEVAALRPEFGFVLCRSLTNDSNQEIRQPKSPFNPDQSPIGKWSVTDTRHSGCTPVAEQHERAFPTEPATHSSLHSITAVEIDEASPSLVSSLFSMANELLVDPLWSWSPQSDAVNLLIEFHLVFLPAMPYFTSISRGLMAWLSVLKAHHAVVSAENVMTSSSSVSEDTVVTSNLCGKGDSRQGTGTIGFLEGSFLKDRVCSAVQNYVSILKVCMGPSAPFEMRSAVNRSIVKLQELCDEWLDSNKTPHQSVGGGRGDANVNGKLSNDELLADSSTGARQLQQFDKSMASSGGTSVWAGQVQSFLHSVVALVSHVGEMRTHCAAWVGQGWHSTTLLAECVAHVKQQFDSAKRKLKLGTTLAPSSASFVVNDCDAYLKDVVRSGCPLSAFVEKCYAETRKRPKKQLDITAAQQCASHPFLGGGVTLIHCFFEMVYRRSRRTAQVSHPPDAAACRPFDTLMDHLLKESCWLESVLRDAGELFHGLSFPGGLTGDEAQMHAETQDRTSITFAMFLFSFFNCCTRSSVF